MRKQWVYAIQLVLSLAIITALTAGCAGSPSTSAPGSVTPPSSKSTSTPPASEYPADISGRVTIAKFLHMRNFSDKRAGTNQVFWVVDISIKNKSYERAVTSDYEEWHIAAGGEVYHQWGGLTQVLHLRDKFTVDDMNVPTGQTGQTTICFSVPDTLKVGDAKLRYQGQEPYSYGKLTGGKKVAVYDWDSKTVIEQSIEKSVNVIVTRIQRSNLETSKLWVTLVPTSSMKADTSYVVRLYENNNIREETKVSWNQPELNVKTEKSVYFILTNQESRLTDSKT